MGRLLIAVQQEAFEAMIELYKLKQLFPWLDSIRAMKCFPLSCLSPTVELFVSDANRKDSLGRLAKNLLRKKSPDLEC